MNARQWFYSTSFHSGLGLETPHIDDSQAVHAERFHCTNCHRTGPLTTALRCGTCNSDSVISAVKVGL